MSDKKMILREVSFGKRTAEEEGDELEKYFVETDEWRRIYSGEVDIVYGPKGSGKSAIYALLSRRESELFDRGVIIVSAENIRGTPVFRDLTEDPPATEDEIRQLWKLYFLALIGHSLRDYGAQSDEARRLIQELEKADLLPQEWSLRRCLSGVVQYVRNLTGVKAVEGEIGIEPGGLPASFTGRIIFHEPTSAEESAGYVSAESLLRQADKALEQSGYKLWIALDRLDVAFAATEDLERNALRALFRVYLDLLGFTHFRLKIFLRNDIWERISESGFREASHITRAINIRWNSRTLINLVVRRVLRNVAIVDFYEVDPQTILGDVTQQDDFFYRVFPGQIDVGPNKPSAFDWMLSRTRDGTKETVPRELIHLFSEARRIQLERLETGFEKPPEQQLFDRVAFREALPEVSRVRLENTLFAEFADAKPWLEALEGEKTEQFPDTLARIWGVKEETALQRADRLAQIGFFEKRGPKREPSFWVPFLYRPALNLSQGSAR